MRRHLIFACAGETLIGTLDLPNTGAAGATGLLIVSGGNELRCGAHRGMAMLAARLATEGVPVFRYDRRGIGDSTGENLGFEHTGEDIAAAVRCFRAEAAITRVVAFGNCDAATALALFGRAAGIDALVLANPWTGGTDDELPAAAAIRARYAAKLRDPREWLRLARGRVNLGKIVKGLRKVAATSSERQASLPAAMASALAALPARLLLAERDNTAIAFRDAWRKLADAPSLPTASLDTASHSFAGPSDAAWLRDQLLAALRDGAVR